MHYLNMSKLWIIIWKQLHKVFLIFLGNIMTNLKKPGAILNKRLIWNDYIMDPTGMTLRRKKIKTAEVITGSTSRRACCCGVLGPTCSVDYQGLNAYLLQSGTLFTITVHYFVGQWFYSHAWKHDCKQLMHLWNHAINLCECFQCSYAFHWCHLSLPSSMP